MNNYYALLFVLMLWVPNSWALRCGSDLVEERDPWINVLRKCGDPTAKRNWVETRTAAATNLNSGIQPGNLPQSSASSSFFSYTVNMEEWIYDFGHQRFMQALTFENGVLINIRSLDYGSR